MYAHSCSLSRENDTKTALLKAMRELEELQFISHINPHKASVHEVRYLSGESFECSIHDDVTGLKRRKTYRMAELITDALVAQHYLLDAYWASKAYQHEHSLAPSYKQSNIPFIKIHDGADRTGRVISAMKYAYDDLLTPVQLTHMPPR